MFGDQRGALTTQECEILDYVTTGATACRIGHALGISERTVHKHLENIYAKLGVHDRLSAVLRAGSGER